jgi:hypothetical protein
MADKPLDLGPDEHPTPTSPIPVYAKMPKRAPKGWFFVIPGYKPKRKPKPKPKG